MKKFISLILLIFIMIGFVKAQTNYYFSYKDEGIFVNDFLDKRINERYFIFKPNIEKMLNDNMNKFRWQNSQDALPEVTYDKAAKVLSFIHLIYMMEYGIPEHKEYHVNPSVNKDFKYRIGDIDCLTKRYNFVKQYYDIGYYAASENLTVIRTMDKFSDQQIVDRIYNNFKNSPPHFKAMLTQRMIHYSFAYGEVKDGDYTIYYCNLIMLLK